MSYCTAVAAVFIPVVSLRGEWGCNGKCNSYVSYKEYMRGYNVILT